MPLLLERERNHDGTRGRHEGEMMAIANRYLSGTRVGGRRYSKVGTRDDGDNPPSSFRDPRWWTAGTARLARGRDDGDNPTSSFPCPRWRTVGRREGEATSITHRHPSGTRVGGWRVQRGWHEGEMMAITQRHPFGTRVGGRRYSEVGTRAR